MNVDNHDNQAHDIRSIDSQIYSQRASRDN